MRTTAFARLLLVGLVFCVPGRLIAQKKGAAPAPACVFDTAAHSVMVTRVLGLSVSRGRGTLPDLDLTRAVGEVIRSKFAAPPTISNLFYPETWFAKGTIGPSRTRSGQLGGFSLRVEQDGAIASSSWDYPSYDQGTEDEIFRVLHAMNRMPEMRTVAALLGSDTARVELVGPLASAFDSASATTPMAVSPLIRVRLPSLQLDSPVSYLGGADPEYPPKLRSKGIDGRVILRFVVAENGRTDVNSIRLVSANDIAFAKSAFEAVTRARFAPARVAACPVAQLVEQVVRFAVR